MSSPPREQHARVFAIDTLIVAVTQLLVRVRGLVLLPLIVQILGTAAYGVWAQVVAFATFLSALVCLNFHLPLVREIAADRSRAPKVFTTLFLATIVLSTSVTAVLALVPGPIGKALLDSEDASAFVRLSLLLMLINNVRLLDTNLYRATGRLALRSAIELVTTIGEIVAVIIALKSGWSLEDVILVMVIWNGTIAVLQTIHCFVAVGVARPEWPIVAAAVAYALPLIPASFANFALDRIDRFVVGYYLGAEGVGIYSANYAVGAIVMMAQTPFQITLLPKVAELWERDRAEAARYIEVSIKIFLTLGIPFVLGIPVIARTLLTLLGNDQISEDAAVTTFLVAAGVMLWGLAIMQAQVFYGAKRTGLWGTITIVATVLNLGLNFALVPAIGVAGAAAATLIAYGGICAAAIALSRSMLPLRIDVVHLATCVVAAGAMCGVFGLVDAHTAPMLAVALVSGAVVYFALVGTVMRARSRTPTALASTESAGPDRAAGD